VSRINHQDRSYREPYEAVAGQLADWHLDYPLNVAALKERLDAGIPARTVL
jgi:hypothetical protein